ncbi:fusaric acid resistance protein [Shewanella colwelliana]|uniref:Fusaric acid resistance protein n=1 Tax=Shewanella colwelliana TaxID=23 RepID=A0ABQ4P984_SHECO|nr:FUSC family protein [Shewanella colwelliana]GIU44112.1 fusaric acid resistance protein [Shewanella colwelliana]
MLSPSIKESIKVSISVGITIALALYFQWDKPYWAAITVIAISATETFGHGVQQGKLRILGTVAGILYALLLISLFSQDHLLFIGFFHLFLAGCVFFSDNKRYGYAFTMAFTVFAIVAMLGGTNGNASFDIAILRIQETMLGVLVYSIVYRLLWPSSTESLFFDSLKTVTSQFDLATSAIEKALLGEYKIDRESDIFDSQRHINKLREILALPVAIHYRLRHEKTKWQIVVEACEAMQANMTLIVAEIDNEVDKQTIVNKLIQFKHELILLEAALKDEKIQTQALALYWSQYTENKAAADKTINAKQLRLRLNNTLTATAISLTCFGLWIYFSIPGGPIFPLVGAVLANVTVHMPDSLIRQAKLASLAWGAVFLAEYCLVLTVITELWQLIAFYMVNMLLIYGLCGKPSLAVQRILGGNLLLIMTMNALHSAPQFEIITPLFMLTMMVISLSVARFYTRLLHIKAK